MGILTLFALFQMVRCTVELHDFLPEGSFSTDDMIQNYEAKKVEIIQLKEYLEKMVPPNLAVYIEFDSSNRLVIMGVNQLTDSTDQGSHQILACCVHKIKLATLEKPYRFPLKERLELDAIKAALNSLDWTIDHLKMLQSKLDQARCISVSNSQNEYSLGFKRVGFSAFYYTIFDDLPIEQIKQEYNDGCNYQYHEENVVLEYAAGVLGPQCLPGFLD
ncbi:MAG: hypothetical protein AAF598_08700 [Bacteroidota bacterium]